MTIAIVGAVSFDDIETPHGAAQAVLGGSAAYAAVAAALLRPAHIISTAGDDLPVASLASLQAHGVRTDGIQIVPSPSFRWHCRYHADLEHRDTLHTDPGVFATTRITVPASAAQATHLFLTSGEPAQNRAALAEFPARKLTMLDTIEREIRDERDALLDVLAQADIVSINVEEAGQLIGAPVQDAEAIYRFIADHGPQTVLLKRGPAGAELLDSHVHMTIPAIPDLHVVDPTGAGDTFAGAALSALACGAPLPDAVRWGCAMASFTVEAFGLDGLLRATREDVTARTCKIGLVQPPWLAEGVKTGARV